VRGAVRVPGGCAGNVGGVPAHQDGDRRAFDGGSVVAWRGQDESHLFEPGFDVQNNVLLWRETIRRPGPCVRDMDRRTIRCAYRPAADVSHIGCETTQTTRQFAWPAQYRRPAAADDPSRALARQYRSGI